MSNKIIVKEKYKQKEAILLDLYIRGILTQKNVADCLEMSVTSFRNYYRKEIEERKALKNNENN